ncbi:uncharacterized protein N7482_000804 [Penicillium canariense]|uniref:ER lumen protein retaining receptor n=1 Tax=Penicillium canariense TaxID=189055 RepID=A0A9W9IEL9_9EURO|nr:uncharacterized protein N7482_000804 [Penicillium canariense]KAJ5174927.1 hypothetical protein N7482_000804 [Penicillium canariense]
MAWNVFRVLADVSHLASICLLIRAIHKNKSAEGVSLLTQLLYAVVFITRYLDLFNGNTWSVRMYGKGVIWNVSFKLFFITSAFYTIFIMMKVFPRTRERERAWKLGIYSVLGSLVLSPVAILLLEKGQSSHWFLDVRSPDLVPMTDSHLLREFLWAFSIILESVCVLPQLLLLRQTTVPTVIDSYYLVALGSYRAFYILNWLVRGFGSEHYWDPVAFFFGVVQTAFYVDFAWVYYSRQRVKLRNGGVVDSDDFSKSWLVNRVMNFRAGRASTDEEQHLHEDEEGGDGRASSNRWGARGISIAADDTLENYGRHPEQEEDDGDIDGVLEEDYLEDHAQRARTTG